MLKRDINTWYIQYYFLCVQAINAFLHGNSYSYNRKFNKIIEQGTNLCQMLRTMLFGTLIMIFSMCLIAFSAYSFIILPLINISGVIVTSLSIIVGSVLILIGVIWTFLKLCRITSEALEKLEHDISDNIVISYISGIKNKYCPIIKITKAENDEY